VARRALAVLFLVACGSSEGGGATTVLPDAGATTVLPDGGTSTTSPPVGMNPDGGGSPAGQRCVVDPIAAVNALSDKGVVLGYQLNGFFDPSTTKHWEGVVRLEGAGAKFLAVSRIGPEMFDIVELASRQGDGEAFGASRSNADTAPPTEDKVIAKVDEDSGFDHAGGMQALGNVLAVPLENGTRSRVVFYDVTTPKTPQRLGVLERVSIGQAGTAGLARLPNGKVLLVVGRKGNQTIDFYISQAVAFEIAGWDLITTWSVDGDGVKTKLGDDDNFGAYQNFNVIPACDGRVFLLGTHRDNPALVSGRDFVDLFTLELSQTAVITKVANRHVFCDGQCNLDAAGGSYITPSGKLIVYATEHDNDGPGGSIKMKEF